MAGKPIEFADEAVAALRHIVADSGPETLSQRDLLPNLLKDLLPDAPGVVTLLVAAAQHHVADTLRDHASQGIEAAIAARLTASAFADASMFTPDACAWAVGAFAIGLGVAPREPTIAAPGAIPAGTRPGSAETPPIRTTRARQTARRKEACQGKGTAISSS